MSGSLPAPAPAPAEPGHRRDRFVLAFLLAALAVLYWRFQFLEHGYTYDTTVYVAGAKALAAGEGYRFVDHWGQPRIGLYPPVTSLVLSLAFRINPHFPENLPWLNSIMIIEALAALAACFVLLRRQGIPVRVTALAVAAVGASPMWISCLFGFFSDVLFSLMCLWLLVWWLPRRETASTTAWAVTGVVIGVAYLTRTAAVALMVGLGLIGLWRWREGRRAPLLGLSLPFMAAVLGWKWLARGGVDYFGLFSVWFERLGGVPGYLHLLGRNLVYTLSGVPFGEVFWPLYLRIPLVAERFGRPLYGIAACLCALPFFGLLWFAARGCRRSRSAIHSSVALLTGLYLIEILVVPFSAEFFYRYFFVLWPLFFLWVWRGLPTLTPPRREMIVSIVLAIMVASNLWLTFRTWRTEKEKPQKLAEFAEVTNWIKDHSAPSELIAADWAVPTLHLHAAIPRPIVADYLANSLRVDAPLRHEAQGRPPASLLISTAQYLRTNAPPALLTLVFVSSQKNYQVYRVDPEREREYQHELYGAAPAR